MQSKKTKIVCTMGPATESEDVLRQLIKAGMNVARFNFSHGSHDYHRAGVARVRKVSAELGIPVAILLLSLIHISEPTRQYATSRMPSSA